MMSQSFSVKRGNARGRSLVVYTLMTVVLLGSGGCAGLWASSGIQPQVTSLVASGRVEEAVEKISAKKASYGANNYLLYYLDRGLIELMAGRYEASTVSFEKAKTRFRELYTRSVTDEAMSWVTNDYALPYRSADFEYVLVNVFQALNYVQMGKIDEALVEARDLDAKYQIIEEIAKNSQRVHFADNGFARFLMGLFYEMRGGPQDLTEALLFYEQSMALYEGYYGNVYMPQVLKENAVALAAVYGHKDTLTKLKKVAHLAWKEKQKKVEIYLIEMVGYSPVKETEMIPIPVEKDLIAPIAFPKLCNRGYVTYRSVLRAAASADITHGNESELGVDIEDIARRDMDAKRALVLTKGILRPVIKTIIEHKQKENIEKKYGSTASGIFGLLASVYNLYTERADLRSWESLPAQVRISRLVLDPGQYQISVQHLTVDGKEVRNIDLGFLDLKAGDKRILLRRAFP